MDSTNYYTCADSSISCPETCIGLASCNECDCALIYPSNGPWGRAMDVIMCLLPLMFLLAATLMPTPLSTTVSLPMAAFLMFLVRIMYLGSDPLLSCSAVILGVHEAITPLTIMAGAITLFETMEVTNCMPFMMREMKALTNGHPVAELLIIFCFAYMVEGASGFGTPVALGAPMLVSLGHDKFESVVTLLLMNTVATVWGAVGTPIWFGFGGLSFDSLGYPENGEPFTMVSYKAGVALAISAFILLPYVLTLIVPVKSVKQNWLFVILGLSCCVLPSLTFTFFSYEFPALIGGLIGCCLNAVLISNKIGLKPFEMTEDESDRNQLDIGTVSENSILSRNLPLESFTLSKDAADLDSTNGNEAKEEGIEKGIILDEYSSPNSSTSGNGVNKEEATAPKPFLRHSSTLDIVEDALGPRKIGTEYMKELTWRTFPIWGTVLLLILTRVPQFGIKRLLTAQDPHFSIYFGTYGTFKMSASLVIKLENILTYPGMTWKYELLYTPFLIPFILVSFITLVMFRHSMHGSAKDMIIVVVNRLKNPAIALVGALILVQLMLKGGTAAPANIIGTILADSLKGGFIVISAFLGIMGSFFSGSTTISNLTFGDIQMIAAETIGTSATTMLALQAAGASAGNGVCLNNIISACAVVGLDIAEGKIIAKTWKFVFAFAIIATVVMLAFFFRFGGSTI